MFSNKKEKFFSIILFATVISLAVPFSALSAHATTTTLEDEASCLALGGTWNGVDRCTVNALTIDAGDKLVVKNNVTLTITSTLDIYGNLRIDEGSTVVGDTDTTFTIYSNGLVWTQGNFEGYNTNNYGKINVSPTGRTGCSDDGSHFINYSGGRVNLQGNFGCTESTVENYGKMNIRGELNISDSILTNHTDAVMNVGSSAEISLGNTGFTNDGRVNSRGLILIYFAGGVENNGTLISNGIIIIQGLSEDQFDNSYFENNGKLSNKGTVIIDEFASLINNNQIHNKSYLLLMHDSSTLDNTSGNIDGLKPIKLTFFATCNPAETCDF